MSFSIITDTAANLTRELLEKYRITAIPLPYFKDGGTKEEPPFTSDKFDGIAYYDALKKGCTVTTSQINPRCYVGYMEPLLREGKDLLFIGMSSGISGSFASAQLAKKELLEKYPERTIQLVDSLGASLGEGLLVLKAARMRDSGKSLEETVRKIKESVPCMYQVFIVDDLAHLRRTGRLSGFGAVVGTVLGIKPVLVGNTEGKIVVIGKVRGRKAAIKELVEKYLKLVKNLTAVGISYAGCPEDAAVFAETIKEKLPPEELIVVQHEPATGSHLGPGALAIYFEGDKDARTH